MEKGERVVRVYTPDLIDVERSDVRVCTCTLEREKCEFRQRCARVRVCVCEGGRLHQEENSRGVRKGGAAER